MLRIPRETYRVSQKDLARLRRLDEDPSMMPTLALSEPPSKVPSSRSGLRFLCRLGQGGMAEVHLAARGTEGSIPDLVVVKRMHVQYLEDTATVRMFLDEARLALRLAHPNIVRAERLGMFDGRHGIVMEFLEGQPLQQVLKRAYESEHSLGLEVVAQIAIAALDGLHYAHELKDPSGTALCVVHRDVSPQNLFVSYDGAVKLLDFGIAKNALQDGRTRTGLLKGKISYMAPEQARGEAIDRRADLWSLGVTLWEAVTGSRLFKGANEVATLNLTLTEEVAAPSLRRPDLPQEFEAILLRALQRDPEQRYPTAAAMRDDLETWLSAREFSEAASIPQLMKRLFAEEILEQREKVQRLLNEQPDLSAESGVTLVAPSLAFSSGTVSGSRPTQVSSVNDLMQELTRQRKATTRLSVSLLALVAIAAPIAVYLLMERSTTASRIPAADAAPGAVAAAPPVALPVAPPVALPVAPPVAPPVPALAAAVATSPAPQPAWLRGGRSQAPQLRRSRAGAESTAQARPEEASEAEAGLLNFDTSPWSVVSVGGRVLGQTPLVGASLPVGTHQLTLTNPELGLRTTYQVTINRGQTTARRVGLN